MKPSKIYLQKPMPRARRYICRKILLIRSAQNVLNPGAITVTITAASMPLPTVDPSVMQHYDHPLELSTLTWF